MFQAIDFRPSTRTLRQFGGIAFVAFTALAVVAWREQAIFAVRLGAFHQVVALGLAALAGLCGALSLLYPKGNWPLYVGLSVVTYPLGWVVLHVLLAVLFVLVLGPVALVLRFTRSDPLTRHYDPRADSYWTKRPESSPPASYFRRF